jgi:hypothetical protein
MICSRLYLYSNLYENEYPKAKLRNKLLLWLCSNKNEHQVESILKFQHTNKLVLDI